MKPKFILSFLVISCISLSVIGQNYNRPPNLPNYDYKKWHFGFTLGPEFQNARIINNSLNIINDPNVTIPENPLINGNTISGIKYYSDIPQLSPGFHVGIITSRRLGDHFNLRIIPSLSLGEKKIESLKYIIESGIKDTTYTDVGITTTVKSTYISIPILFKYKAVRIENARPYMIAGVNFKYDLNTDFEDPITLKKIDTSLEFGLGSDFYMQTFRLGIELRFGIGLMNMLQSDRTPHGELPDLTATIDKITAKTFTIAINFE